MGPVTAPISLEEDKKTMMKYTVALVICLLSITLTSGENVSNKKPKLFYVSTSSTTSTVSTTTLCYTSIANSAVTSCGRKKRAILDEALGITGNIEADRTSADIEDDDAAHEDLISGMDEATSSDGRQGKFLLYWLTTTSTSTLTSYTTTTTLVVSCIPGGISVCG